jgi:5-formyltetrahydrofolate cyclo-ligase
MSVKTQPEAADLAAMAAIDAAAIAGAKQTLRKAVLFRRDARTRAQREHDDEARMEIIEASLEDRIPDTVAAYLSNGSEPGTLQLVAWLAAHSVRVLLPCCPTRLAVVSISRPGRPMKGPTHCALARTQSWNQPVTWYRASNFQRQN